MKSKKYKIFTLVFIIAILSAVMTLNTKNSVEQLEGTFFSLQEAPQSSLAFINDVDLSDSDASFIGEDVLDQVGRSMAGVGDVNNDGYDDILIGTIIKNGEAGKVYLILGGDSESFSINMDLTNANGSFLGESAYDYAGYSLAGAGDVNNDGYDDILIGAYCNDEGSANAGQVYLIFGSETESISQNMDLSNANASFIGENTNNAAGNSIASAGDVNNDGYDDILIGAYTNSEGGTNAGKAYLIFGNESNSFSMDMDLSMANASFIGESGGDSAGYSVAGAGDINNDGYDDILIGANFNDDGGPQAGKSYLIFGGDSTSFSMSVNLSDADASFISETAGDSSGKLVAGAGDINNDGYDDILIGANFKDDEDSISGQVYLIYGGENDSFSINMDLSNANASFIGENPNDYAGHSVAGVGDINDDGYDDILIGAYGNDEGGNNAGQVYLIYGGEPDFFSMDIDLSNANASFIGANPNDCAGWSVAGAGDFNGDGNEDLLIGAHQGEGWKGEAFLVLGPDLFAPNWLQIPENQEIELGHGFNYDLNASDNVEIDKYQLNETNEFQINSNNGIITNAILVTVGIYWLDVSVNDTSGNTLTTAIKITVIDTTAPVWNTIPEDQIIKWGDLLVYDLNATDFQNIIYSINNTVDFKINSNTGLLENNTNLSVGVYSLQIIASDGTNDNIITITITVEQLPLNDPDLLLILITSITSSIIAIGLIILVIRKRRS